MNRRTQVAVIDDHPLFREGVACTLRSAPDLEIVGEGSSAYDAVEIAKGKIPDIMLLDVSMPGSGIEAAREIMQSGINTKVIILTVSHDDRDVTAAMQAGVSGYVAKGSSGAELLRVVRAVHAGETYITPALAMSVLRKLNRSQGESQGSEVTVSLTPREEQVLHHLSRGFSNRAIAGVLGIAEQTVKNTVSDLIRKYKARNRLGLALLAGDRNLGQSLDS
jgi:two-component system nitrate/nitrite response regulator NarL